MVHLSLDINELVRLVKRAAVDAVRADAPMAICYGVVACAAPLKITVDQKLVLTQQQLILTGLVQDTKIEMDVDHETESASHEHTVTGTAADVGHSHAVTGAAPGEDHEHQVTGTAENAVHGHAVTGRAQPSAHSHRYRGRKTVTLHWGLRVGEQVILLRCDGGQKYVVLDRWKAGT